MPAFDFETFPELETGRLRLRRITPGDAGAWLEVWNHPDVLRYLLEFEQDALTVEDVNGIVQWADDIFTEQSGLRWAICLKPDSTLIGSCGFHLYRKAHRRAEIGYELRRDYWRRGIMAEALAAALDFGFQRLNLHRVEANVTAGNEASAGLLRYLGFRLEGTWRDRVYARRRFHALWQFALLEDEFHTRQQMSDNR